MQWLGPPVESGFSFSSMIRVHLVVLTHAQVASLAPRRYADLHLDPEWWGLLGRRRRVLMAKAASAFSVGNSVQSISSNLLRAWQQQQQHQEQHGAGAQAGGGGAEAAEAA